MARAVLKESGAGRRKAAGLGSQRPCARPLGWLRLSLLLCGAVAAWAQQPQKPVYQEPPEEDETLATARQYTFNPLQSKKEMDTGNFYYKKGNYSAAANRYVEATLWDEFSPEPFYKLGEAYEKLEDYARAREAFRKFAGLTSDKGKAEDVRKRIAKYPAESHPPPAHPPVVPQLPSAR